MSKSELNKANIDKWFKQEKDAAYQLYRSIQLLAKKLPFMRQWADVEQFLSENAFWLFPFNVSQARLVREWYELATLFRGMMYSADDAWRTFINLTDLYIQLLKLRRTSHNQIMEQFSTPLPVAHLLGLWTSYGIRNQYKPVYATDPTAGNGLLMYYYFIIAGYNRKMYVYLNELDPLRYFNLKLIFGSDSQIFIKNKDFFEFTEDPVRSHALLVNPPFTRSAQAVSFSGKDGETYKFKTKSFAFTLRALDTILKDNGRAACIIHGSAFDIDRTRFWDEKGRPKQGEERNFWFYLYRHYNVVDVIYIDGRLWAKQGQETNLRIILIDGRRHKAHKDIFPPLYTDWIKVIDSWDALYDRINATIVPLKDLTAKYLSNS